MNPIIPDNSIEAKSVATVVDLKMTTIRNAVRKLVVSVFKEGHLLDKIIEAQNLNDVQAALHKGVRLGYMGHLTYISDEICKLFEKCNDLVDEFGYFSFNLDGDNQEWLNYKIGALALTKERDMQLLGGPKPIVPVISNIPMLIGHTNSDDEVGPGVHPGFSDEFSSNDFE